ncbi:hypothetical protein [Novosphingobium sp. FKTRR1]|nr:hypothetical protein [Novosphingobium sp. FKTRR1]
MTMVCARLFPMLPGFPLTALALSLGLAGCTGTERRTQAIQDDPMMTEAIEGQLLVDPDLSQQNMRNYAVVPPGPVDKALPTGADLVRPPAH